MPVYKPTKREVEYFKKLRANWTVQEREAHQELVDLLQEIADDNPGVGEEELARLFAGEVMRVERLHLNFLRLAAQPSGSRWRCWSASRLGSDNRRTAFKGQHPQRVLPFLIAAFNARISDMLSDM